MKDDWVFIALLLLVVALFPAALGADWVFAVLHVISGWLMALPAPTESWVKLVGGLAWPAAIVFVAWWFYDPLHVAAHNLATRIETDDVEVGRWLKVTSKPVATYSQAAVTQNPDTPEAADVNHAEAILEYAADSGEHVDRIVEWIYKNVGPTCDIEAFFYDAAFAEKRAAAYKELIEGKK